jgi:hypothetical protein
MTTSRIQMQEHLHDVDPQFLNFLKSKIRISEREKQLKSRVSVR